MGFCISADHLLIAHCFQRRTESSITHTAVERRVLVRSPVSSP